MPHIGFIDVGFLKGSTASALAVKKHELQVDASAVVDWCRSTAEDHSDRMLRAYWYDGAFDPEHSEAASQRSYLDAVAFIPGVQLRLGNIAERRSKHKRPMTNAMRRAAAATGVDSEVFLSEFAKVWDWRAERQQKGVDTRIVLDLVRLAQKGVYSTALLIAGDRDLAEAVRVAQDDGCRVTVAAPTLRDVAKELKQLADEVIEIRRTDLERFVVPSGAGTQGSLFDPGPPSP